MLMEIVKYGSQVLRKKAKNVTRFDQDLENLVENMFETMYQNHGIGLAAPQVSVSQKIMVIDTQEEENPPLVLINPKIKGLHEEKVKMQEGCLSFPGITVDVDRYKDIQVFAQDVHGEKYEIEAHDLLARVIQHENDHLEGVLFIDYMNIVQKSLMQGKLKKLQKETLANFSAKS